MLNKISAEELINLMNLDFNGIVFYALVRFEKEDTFVFETFKYTDGYLKFWDIRHTAWSPWLRHKHKIEYVISQMEKPENPLESFFSNGLIMESKGLYTL
jgi:hypothetical protein